MCGSDVATGLVGKASGPSLVSTGKGQKKTRRPTKTKVLHIKTDHHKNVVPGSVLTLLAGRHRGKRVVLLKQLQSGFLLVTSPPGNSGKREQPFIRVGQRFCLATSEKMNIDRMDFSKVDDSYFEPRANTCASLPQLDAMEVTADPPIEAPTVLSDLQAIVVNLERRADRMQACANSCATHCPWLSYRRFEATDGRKDEIKESEVTLSWDTGMNCVYQRLRSVRKGWNDLDNYVPRELRLSPGERGCSLSHVRAWRRCLELGRPLVVLEDDAVLMPEFTPVLSRALAALPRDAQVLYLGYSQAAAWRREVTPELVESEYVWTTVGYVIWPSGAQQFLSQLPVNQPVDNWMASKSASGELKAYAVRPKIVRQAEEWGIKSDVGHSDEELGLTVRNVSQTAGSRIYLSHNTHHSVDVWSDHSVNQQWKLSKDADGPLYTIQTAVSTSGGRTYLSHDTHYRVDLWCEAGPNQRWSIQKVCKDTYTIRAASIGSGGRMYLGCTADGNVELFSEACQEQQWVIPDFEFLE